ncbi:MAG: hypothetical protein SVR94_05175, partial [Pseudomonadota bacterium]|nr:hypothetical protein [Pseudomonadota bacterium]
ESHLTATFFQGLNYHRELIAERCPAILIFWLSESGVRQLATQAADFWAWRSGVFDFSVPLQPRPAAIAERIDEDRASRAERLARIEAIGEYLADYTESDSRRADLLQECGILQESLGEWALAMADLEAARTLYQALADQLNATITLGYIARIKTDQGEIEAALNLYQYSLQLFEKLGARREYAIISEEINQLLTQEESGYPRKQSIFKRFWRWLKHK